MLLKFGCIKNVILFIFIYITETSTFPLVKPKIVCLKPTEKCCHAFVRPKCTFTYLINICAIEFNVTGNDH